MADALDKRIRAVYDAFDIRNYKAAIKLSNAGLQKYPDCQVFRSLKAVALERTGKPEEALQVAEQVLAASPPDDHVLNLLLLVLKPANRTGDLLAAYQAACSKDPGNQELAVGLFACHVRAFAFREQQAQAMKLNKAFPCELHQWWVVCSLALQAHAAAATSQLAAAQEAAGAGPAAAAGGGSGLGVPQLLQLAEAMAARLLAKTGGSSSWEAVMLYLGLLQAQGKYDAALAALRGPLGGAISLTAERREAEAALLLGQGQLAAAAALYEAALAEQPDDWAVLLLYLDCLLPGTAASLPACSSTAVAQMLAGVEASTRPTSFLAGGLPALLAAAATAGEPASPSLQERLDQAAAFINSLPTAPPALDTASNAAGGSSSEGSGGAKPPALLRGPALARVELIKRRMQLGLAQQQELVDALLQHHDKFGHVVSCAVDVYCYLALLDAAARQSLGQQLSQRAQQVAEQLRQQQQQRQQSGEISQKDAAAQVKLLRRQMSALQIQADLGLPSFPDATAAQAHALGLLQQYASVALPLQAALALDERERGPADELLWLAAAALMAAAALAQQETRNDMQQPMAFMLQALLVLEAAAAGRPYCARVQLGLTGLHGLLGNPRAARQHFGQLDVKHIQHDTLSGQHLVPLLLGLRDVPAARELLAATAALFEDHLRDAGDTLMQAYKHGTHTKVLEFVCFKERLERSHTWALTRAEAALLSIAEAAAGKEPAAAEAVGAAAHAAAAALPLQLLDSCDWRGMRFNDDLTTRLPWLPPIAGPRHLAVLLWWEQQQQQHGQQQQQQQQQQCWWRCVSAAEADLSEAAALRAAMRAAAQQRWLLPHLLDAALHAGAAAAIGSSSSGGGGAAAASQPDPKQQQHMLQLLNAYASAQGAADAAGLELRVESWLNNSSSGLALSQQLQLLDAALFTLAGSVQDLLAAAGHEEAESAAAAAAGLVPRAARLASALQQLQRLLLPQLQPSAAFLGRLLPGATLSAAALLVEEGCCWAACCLEAWSKAISKARKRTKPKKPAAAAAAPVLQQPGVQAALEQLQALQAALTGLLSAVAQAAEQLLSATPAGEEPAAVLLAAFDLASNNLVQGLVGWEARLSVHAVVKDAVRAQRELLQQVAGSAAKLQKRIHGLAW